jgi:hypothetical protein
MSARRLPPQLSRVWGMSTANTQAHVAPAKPKQAPKQQALVGKRDGGVIWEKYFSL